MVKFEDPGLGVTESVRISETAQSRSRKRGAVKGDGRGDRGTAAAP